MADQVQVAQMLPPVEGYPKLACHIGRYAEAAIYRRFSSLNAQNILYKQAELVHLEIKLRRLETGDAASVEGNRSTYSRDWYWLNNSKCGESSEQLKSAMDISQKLKDYNDAVIQQSVMSHLADPNPQALRSLQQWLERPGMGNLALIGKDMNIWGNPDEPISPHNDLLAVSPPVPRDVFSTWFTERFVPRMYELFFYRLKNGDDLESGIVSYDEDTIHRYTSNITTILASLLPILAIVVLYCLDSMKARLGLIALFSFTFTTALSFFTSATRAEIFIATSTFAAVQVVFIATGTGNEGGSLVA